MNHFTRATTVRGALLAAAALLTAGQAPAQAAPGADSPGNWLYVTVTHGDARAGNTRGTLLTCDPPQGHARAADACAELETAAGDIGAVPPKKEVYCPMIYAPVTARAKGVWNGRPVQYTHTFSNGCELTARTGDVFALDD